MKARKRVAKDGAMAVLQKPGQVAEGESQILASPKNAIATLTALS
jgi:hypothetical protein